MERAEALVFLGTSRVGRLATVRPNGRPHVVPVTFAVTDEVVVTMIDHKPKTTNRLQRLTNIEVNPGVSLIVDQWSEDWDRLRWVRVDGTARVHTEGPMWDQSRAALVAKYPQYGEQPPEGPAIAIAIERVSGWASKE